MHHLSVYYVVLNAEADFSFAFMRTYGSSCSSQSQREFMFLQKNASGQDFLSLLLEIIVVGEGIEKMSHGCCGVCVQVRRLFYELIHLKQLARARSNFTRNHSS